MSAAVESLTRPSKSDCMQLPVAGSVVKVGKGISGWPVEGTEGRLPPSSEIAVGTSGTSSVKGDVAVGLQSEVDMGDIVGDIMEGPVGKESGVSGGRDFEFAIIDIAAGLMPSVYVLQTELYRDPEKA